jgi:hypothetical protein
MPSRAPMPADLYQWRGRLALSLYALLVCYDLPHAWKDDPLNRYGAITFGIWIASAIAVGLHSRRTPYGPSRSGQFWWIIPAFVLLTFGSMGDLNVLKHFGLALCVASFFPLFRQRAVIFAAAISWMPFFGWAGHSLFGANLDLLRIPVALITAVCWHAGSGTLAPQSGKLARVPAVIRKHIMAIVLILSLALCGLWEWAPLADASGRFAAIPEHGATFSSRSISLTDTEVESLQGAAAIKRLYADQKQLVWFMCVDGSKNRNAVHDPSYCLLAGGCSIETKEEVAIPGGVAQRITFRRAAETTQMLYWFYDGESCYHSLPRYWFATTLRRISLGQSGDEPVLFILRPHQSAGDRPPDWNHFIQTLFPEWDLSVENRND